MNRYPENPLAALLELRRKPQQGSPWVRLGWLLPALALPPLTAYPPAWAPGLPALAGILMAGAYPCHLAAQQSSLLASLRQNECLPEVLGCSTAPGELLDGLARYSLQQVWARPLVGLVLWAYALVCWVGPAGLLLAPLGLLAQGALAVLLSYLAQCGAAWSRAEDDVLLRHLLVWAVLAPGLLLTGEASAQAVGGHWLGALGETAAAVVMPALALRWLARQGLAHYEQLDARLKSFWDQLGGRVRNVWVDLTFGSWMANPVVFRETSREARRIPRGLPGLMWRHGDLILLWGGFLGIVYYGLLHGWARLQVGLWGFLVIIFLLQTLRAAYRTVGALVDERDGRTLEGLMLTELSPAEWVDGWAAVGWLPRSLENLLGGVVLVAVAVPIGLSPLRALVAGLLVALFSIAASYVGLAVSAAASSRPQAYDRLGLELSRLWVGGVAALLLSLVGPALLSWLGLALGAPWLVHLRRRSLASISQPLGRLPEFPVNEILHRGLRQTAPAGASARLMDRLQKEGLVS